MIEIKIEDFSFIYGKSFTESIEVKTGTVRVYNDDVYYNPNDKDKILEAIELWKKEVEIGQCCRQLPASEN